MIEVIPAGASAVVTENERHERGDRYGYVDCERSYGSSERVKDRIAALDVAESERFHKVSNSICDANSDNAARSVETLKAIYQSTADVQTHTSKDIRDAEVDVTKAITDNNNQLSKAITDSSVALTKAVTDSSFASSLAFANVQNALVTGFKDARYDAATLTASLQASICAGVKELSAQIAEASKENVMLFKDAELRAAHDMKELALSLKDGEILALKNRCELSAQIAACCCEMKQEVAGVKDALKQQEIDRLREELENARRGH